MTYRNIAIAAAIACAAFVLFMLIGVAVIEIQLTGFRPTSSRYARIKFRAWDRNERDSFRMKYNLSLNSAYFQQETLEGIEVMQYTGLADKKGREIYEGDFVVKSFNGTEERRGVVAYGPGANFNLDCEDNDDQEGGRFRLGNPAYPENLEVIGNIYENPEPLK